MTRRTWAIALLACACGDTPESGPREELLDPESCAECHPKQHREWLGSMHAYAAEDPVFRAMNARGQRETNGELGDFCVECHAPLAVALGLTEDGLNLDEVPQHLQGVTCYFCHNVENVTGTHNNPIELAMDNTMRGAFEDPVDNDMHASAYSLWIDERTHESGQMCGSCHDIVTHAGVHLERTYEEWLGSFMSDVDPVSGAPVDLGQRCTTCHHGYTPTEVGYEKTPQPGPIADAPGVVTRDRVFNHHMAAVDVALTDFPSDDPALAAELRGEQVVQIFELLDTSLCATVCVNPAPSGGTNVDIFLHNEFSAHSFPSGAAQDRRVWVELEVFAGEQSLLRSGAVADDQSVDAHAASGQDPLLWLFRDRMLDEAGNEVHMFWEAREVESNLLRAADMLTPTGDASTWVSRRFHVDSDAVDLVTMRGRMRPMDFSVLDDLVASGDLDPAVREAMPTFNLAPWMLTWTPALAQPTVCRPEVPDCDIDYGMCVSSSMSCGANVGAPLPE
jgi:hypothetical protein